ncbi:MAG: NAD(P)H-dependent oxidoreductase [Desulfobacteraceae bacterium]|nr:NAD(P)H-dependent oxidoreductase [Desulfobacteraceae bacterium]
MFVLGLQGSPRVKGNTSILLSTFLGEAERLGARTEYLDVAKRNISPCQECGVCEQKGFCPIDDDMQEVYLLLRHADLIVIATPVFFYGVTAQLKALIDRSQALWSRRYVLGLTDPGRGWRKGFLLAVGATKGKNLFEGVNLTAKYFFDAVGASFDGTLAFNQIEGSGDITKHPTALGDAKEKARTLVAPFLDRKKVLFVCTENACRSQMASAFAQHHAGDRIEAISAGSAPAKEINPLMIEVMAEKDIDMAFRKPKTISAVAGHGKPDLIISMGCGDACPLFPDVPNEEWNLEDPAGKPISLMREIRDDIEKRVIELVGN